MPVNDKLAHFARRDAFRLPMKAGAERAATMRLPRKGLPDKLGPGGIDAAGGNVTRQSYPVIGRPCMGIPTARLVHGREYMVREGGKLAFARCGECPVKAACQFIVDERLNANDRIRDAHREFKRRGGAEAYWSGDPSRSRAAGAALLALVRELQAVGFATVNDAAVAAHYDQRTQNRREANAERQRTHRVGVRDNEARNAPEAMADAEVIVREAKRLRERVRAAQDAAGCPRWLAGIDATFVVRVWAVRAALSARGDKHGATHIASALGSPPPGADHDALRFRVLRALKRLPQIEGLP